MLDIREDEYKWLDDTAADIIQTYKCSECTAMKAAEILHIADRDTMEYVMRLQSIKQRGLTSILDMALDLLESGGDRADIELCLQDNLDIVQMETAVRIWRLSKNNKRDIVRNICKPEFDTIQMGLIFAYYNKLKKKEFNAIYQPEYTVELMQAGINAIGLAKSYNKPSGWFSSFKLIYKSSYSSKEFNVAVKALIDGMDIKDILLFYKEDMDYTQMEVARDALYHGEDISEFYKPEFMASTMKLIREVIRSGFNIQGLSVKLKNIAGRQGITDACMAKMMYVLISNKANVYEIEQCIESTKSMSSFILMLDALISGVDKAKIDIINEELCGSCYYTRKVAILAAKKDYSDGFVGFICYNNWSDRQLKQINIGLENGLSEIEIRQYCGDKMIGTGKSAIGMALIRGTNKLFTGVKNCIHNE